MNIVLTPIAGLVTATVKGQGSRVRVKSQGSRVKGQGSGVKGEGSRVMDKVTCHQSMHLSEVHGRTSRPEAPTLVRVKGEG